MQDHACNPGETNAAEDLVSKLINYYKVKQIYVIDAHFFGRDWVNNYPIVKVSAVDLLKKNALEKYPEAVFLAPDVGSQIRTKLTGAKKKRHNSFEVSIECDADFKNVVNGKIVGVVDDIVETGGTVSKFAEECRLNGAKEVIALITHGVLVSGIKRLETAYSAVYLTNSIKREDANVDVSGLILDAIIKGN
jgi:ribose-phosphate pyrophosphokinase